MTVKILPLSHFVKFKNRKETENLQINYDKAMDGLGLREKLLQVKNYTLLYSSINHS